jgi:transcription elongation factor
MRLDPPEVTVKISSEVETLPKRSMNYNMTVDIKAKNPDIFVKLKNPPRHNPGA